MKKLIANLFIVGTLVIVLPKVAYAGACLTTKYKILKNELSCVQIRSNCNGESIEFINNCSEDVYYTGLQCWDHSISQFEKDAGFDIRDNEVLLSRKRTSSPWITEDSYYFGRINALGGTWFPCREDKSFYDEKSKQMTVKFRKNDQTYEIITHLPDAPDRVNLWYKNQFNQMYVAVFGGILIISIFFIYKIKKKYS